MLIPRPVTPRAFGGRRRRVYLDWNAGAPLRRGVCARLSELLADARPGNPSSIHAEGRAAGALLDRARRQVATVAGAAPLDVLWTSGGTEANHLALLGTIHGHDGPVRVAVDPLSHPSVLEPLHHARDRGRIDLAELPVERSGRIDPREAARCFADVRPHLVSLCLVHHELGIVQDVPALARAARDAAPGAVVHVDGVQALGKVPVDRNALDADLLALSSHKVGGPAGAGALVIRRRVALDPPWRGGAQERGLRPGTQPLLAIVGFGVAAELAEAERPAAAARLADLRGHLVARLAGLPGVRIYGEDAAAAGGTVLLGCDGADGQVLVMALDLEGFAVSTGAACSAGAQAPVAALLATGHGEAAARSAIRVSFGPGVETSDLDAFVAALDRVLTRVRGAGTGVPAAAEGAR